MTIELVAKEVSYSKSHIQALFTEVFGESMMRIFMRMKIIEAVNISLRPNVQKDILEVINLSDYAVLDRATNNLYGSTFKKLVENEGIIMESKKLDMLSAELENVEFNIRNLVCELIAGEYVWSEHKTGEDVELLGQYINSIFTKKEFLEEAYKINPQNPLTSVFLGIDSYVNENIDSSETHFRKAIEYAQVDLRFKGVGPFLLIYAMWLHCESRNEEAVHVTEDAIIQMPDCYFLPFYRGLFALHGENEGEYENLEFDNDESMKDELEEINAHFTRAIQLNENYAPAYYFKGKAGTWLNKKGDDDFKKARQLDKVFSCVIM